MTPLAAPRPAAGDRDARSVLLVTETLDFLRRAMRASGAMLYWITPSLATANDEVRGIPSPLVERYRHEMNVLDPLRADRLVTAGREVALLWSEAEGCNDDDLGRYRRFLSAYDVIDNLEFVLWDGPRAYAGISVVRKAGDPPLPEDGEMLAALRRYVEFNMAMHGRVRALRLETMLKREVGLTPREYDVTTLICRGASNQDIADLHGLRLATVKSYVQQVFDKMGVDNRAALVARVNGLQFT